MTRPGRSRLPTFILIHKNPDKPEQTAEVLKFFNWAYKNGDKLASDLDYVPLPDNVVSLGPGGMVEGHQEQVRRVPAEDVGRGRKRGISRRVVG